MIEYSLKTVAEICSGKLIGNSSSTITHLLIDSRSLSLPEESLFFAIINVRDGHNYIKTLFNNGVKSFVVSSLKKEYKDLDANFILVENTLKALHQISTFHRTQFNIPIYGITGSNGKTIIKEWLFQALHSDYNTVRNPRSYNSQFGVPLSIWNIDKKHEIGFFEAGLSKPNEMVKLEKIIQPTIGIFTYLGDAHQSNFKNLEQKVSEKIKLFKNCKLIIYNKDDSIVNNLITETYHTKKIFTWSYNNKSDIVINNIENKRTFSYIHYTLKNQNYKLKIDLNDKASICNIMHIVSVLVNLNLNFSSIQDRILSLQPVAMRLEIIQGINNCLIINDSYNSDINSLDIALSFTSNQSHHSDKTIILSDIYQSELSEKNLYRHVYKLLKIYKFNKIIGIGNKISRNCEIFKDIECYFFNSTNALTEYLQKNKIINNETLLLKGSRRFKFEKISSILEQRLHQTVMEINLNAMVKNLNYYKSKLLPKTKIMVMVKAFSYGTGSYEIANLLEKQGIDYLAVAFADEGSELRENGISTPIVVMNPEPHSFHSIVENNLEIEVYNFRILNEFINYLKENGLKLFPVHLKFDSGMNRSGFGYNDIDALSKILLTNNEIYVSSVFSHLAGSDNEDLDEFSHSQIKRFELSFKLLEEKTEYIFQKHILNTAGIERFKNAQYNMVRLGIGLYGGSIKENKDKIENVATLKTVINQIRQVPKNETVGYNRHGILKRDSTIAILPIGYADGIDRKLGNGNFKMLVNDIFAPTIGDICMDMCMIDITNIPNISEGDEVIIFGDKQPISEIAKKLGTISYEIITSISRRVKRVYYKQ